MTERGRERRVVAVVNPAAGDGMDRARLMAIRQAVHGPPFGGVYLTLRRGHAQEWARMFRREAGFLVHGGDGTLHEIVSGMELKSQAVAPVAAGDASALARELGHPTLAAACAAVEGGGQARLDLLSLILRGKDGGALRRRATGHVAAGYPAIALLAAKEWRESLGAAGAAVGAGLAAFRDTPCAASVRIDGGRYARRALTGLLIANLPRVGPFRIVPEASAADGRCEVLELSASGFRQTLHNLAVLTRTRFYLPARPAVARRVSVIFEVPQLVVADGEPYEGVCRLEVSVLRGGLRVFRVPA